MSELFRLQRRQSGRSVGLAERAALRAVLSRYQSTAEICVGDAAAVR
jgi:hypothetical protein